MDYAEAGQIPDVLSVAEKAEVKTELEEQKLKANPKTEAKHVAFGIKTVKLALTRACSRLRLPDGTQVKIVDKELDDLEPGEITVYEVDQADSNAIWKTVNELSGVGKEAAKAAKLFPEEQAPDGVNPPSSEALRPASN